MAVEDLLDARAREDLTERSTGGRDRRARRPLRPGAEQIPALIEEFETKGAEHWARRTMDGRLGEHFPDAGVEWCTQFMGRAPVSSLIGFNRGINYADIRADLPKIKCPTLVITTEESGLGAVGARASGSR